jgi:hypothetical protein
MSSPPPHKFSFHNWKFVKKNISNSISIPKQLHDYKVIFLSIQILHHTLNTCLENYVEKLKLQIPTMTKIHIINHLMKFHFIDKKYASMIRCIQLNMV